RFEVNQPLHAFDLAKLRGPAVVVRRAQPNEKIVTLDGVERTLSPEMTAICDAARPTIIAGVMGSAESEVAASTTDLVLECAYFQPTRVRRTRRAGAAAPLGRVLRRAQGWGKPARRAGARLAPRRHARGGSDRRGRPPDGVRRVPGRAPPLPARDGARRARGADQGPRARAARPGRFL